LSHETSVAESPVNVARLFTARYLVPKPILMGVVPVRISMRPPLVPLPYELEETAWALVPEPWVTGEWSWLSPTYWRLLDGRGVEKIAEELVAISSRHGGKPVALLDHEDVTKGDRSLRIVAARWLEEQIEGEVPELADDGRALRFDALPKRTRPKKPKVWRQDRRWRDDAALNLSWPLAEEDVRRWIAVRHWQQARSRSNPHAYTVRSWGSDEAFWLVVQHIREHGEREEWGGDTYTYYVCDERKYWTMGSDLMSTMILNRKPWGQDPGDREERNERPEEAWVTPALFYGRKRA
jgi:hypothetical protein